LICLIPVDAMGVAASFINSSTTLRRSHSAWTAYGELHE